MQLRSSRAEAEAEAGNLLVKQHKQRVKLPPQPVNSHAYHCPPTTTSNSILSLLLMRCNTREWLLYGRSASTSPRRCPS